MAEGKNSFVLYRDNKELWEELSDEQAGKLIKHIFRYINDENPSAPDDMTKLLFLPIKYQLKRDLKKYESICKRNKSNGKKGGRPKKDAENEEDINTTSAGSKKPKKPSGLFGNPEKPKKPDSDSDSDSDINKKGNQSLEERKQSFKKQIVAQKSDKYDVDLLKDFFLYWSEHSEGGKKMKWEYEKTFSIASRLHTFYRNKQKWETTKKVDKL